MSTFTITRKQARLARQEQNRKLKTRGGCILNGSAQERQSIQADIAMLKERIFHGSVYVHSLTRHYKVRLTIRRFIRGWVIVPQNVTKAYDIILDSEGAFWQTIPGRGNLVMWLPLPDYSITELKMIRSHMQSFVEQHRVRA